MGWKGFAKSVVAMSRRIERENVRRANEATKVYKSILKQQEFENGQKAVQGYDEYISFLLSFHKQASEIIDWKEVLKEQAPIKPTLKNDCQKLAESNLEKYKPSFFDKILGLKNMRISRLENLVLKSKEDDKKIFEQESKQYELDFSQWEKYQNFANGLIASDVEMYKNVTEYFELFGDIKEIGSGLKVHFEKNFLVIDLLANGTSIIPDFILSQNANGKISKKKMPIGKFNELYQDYICSCVLRIARESFSFLLVESVFINVLSDLLNQSTGHLEQQTILSVLIPKTTLNTLNFDKIDPSDSMKNFKHNMKFSKTNGFGVVSNLSHNNLTKG